MTSCRTRSSRWPSRPSGLNLEAVLNEVGDDFVDNQQDLIPELLTTRGRADVVRDLLQELDAAGGRYAEVLRYRFGFITGEPETLETIGRICHLTRERIRQIEKIALDHLRCLIGLTDESKLPASPDKHLSTALVHEVLNTHS